MFNRERRSKTTGLGRIGRVFLSFAIASTALVGFAIIQAPAAHAAGSGLTFYWKNDAGTTTSISRTAFTTGTCTPAVISTIDFDWGTGSPSVGTGNPSGCNANGFTTYATGYVSALNGSSSKTLYFCDQSDDGFYLMINGTTVIDNWVEQGASATCNNTPANSSFTFAANTVYTVQVWHHENTGGASMRLLVSTSATGTFNTISPTYLATSPSQLQPSSTLPSTMPTITYAQTSYIYNNYISGGTTPYTYSISSGALPSLLSMNTSTGALTYNSGGTVSAGTYNFTVRATDANGMYVDSASQIQVLKVPIAITASAFSQQYGTISTLTEYSYVGSLQYSDTFTVSETSTASNGANVGSYLIYPSVSFTSLGSECSSNAANCYTIATYTGTLTISSRPITVKAKSISRVFGQTNPSLTGFTISSGSLYGSDTLTISTSTTATQSSNVGTYPISITGSTFTSGTSGNYSISLQNDTLTVTQAETITVTAVPPNSAVVGTAYTSSYTVTGLASVDSITSVSFVYTGLQNDGSQLLLSSYAPDTGGYYTETTTSEVFQISGGISNYKGIIRNSGSFTVARKAPTLILTYPPSGTSITYSTPISPSVITYEGGIIPGNPPGNKTYSSNTPSVCTTYSSGDLNILRSGTCSIQLTVPQSTNYETVTVTSVFTVTVAPRTLTLTVDTATVKFASTTTVRASTTLISDGTVTYSTSTSSICSINSTSGVVTLLASSGTCLAGASISTGIKYDSATASSISITAAKADPLIITAASPTTFTYTPGMSIPTNSYSVSGLPLSETLTALSYSYAVRGTTCATGGTCSIGDIAPDGGIVFYVSATVIDSATGISNGGTYLSVAPVSQEGTAQYGCTGVSTPGTSYNVGSGAANTLAILTACSDTSTASYKSANLTYNGYSDYFMPSELEMTAIYNNLYLANPSLGGFTGADYGSSSEGTNGNGYQAYWWFGSGAAAGQTNKSYVARYRPIRAFGRTCATGGICLVGDTGPAGGTIFYVSNSGFTCGPTLASTCNYLELAPAAPTATPWSINYTTTAIGASARNTAIGSGYANTKAIATQNGTYNSSTNKFEAGVTQAYSINGYSDWYMPAKDELVALNTYELTAANPNSWFTYTYFFNSSSEYNANRVWGIGMWAGATADNGVGKTDNNWVIPIRSYPGPTATPISGNPTTAGNFVITPSAASFTFGSASDFTSVVYTAGSLVINKATQALLRVNNLYTLNFDQIKNTSFSLYAVGGSDTGTATFAFTSGPNTTCSMPTSSTIISATTGTCLVSVTKAATINYLTATSDTATVSFIQFFVPYFAPIAGAGSIAVPYTPPTPTVDPDKTPTFSAGSYSAQKNTTLTISGSGFTGINEVDFDSGEVVMITPVNDTTITLTVPNTAQSGPLILVKTRSNGSQLFARTNFTLLP